MSVQWVPHVLHMLIVPMYKGAIIVHVGRAFKEMDIFVQVNYNKINISFITYLYEKLIIQEKMIGRELRDYTSGLHNEEFDADFFYKIYSQTATKFFYYTLILIAKNQEINIPLVQNRYLEIIYHFVFWMFLSPYC